jgi:DNA-binding beta-propeller fold protein YncE
MAPDGKTLYVIGQAAGMTLIDTTTNTAGAAITDHTLVASDMAITPDGETIFIADEEDSQLVLFSTATPIQHGHANHGITDQDEGCALASRSHAIK